MSKIKYPLLLIILITFAFRMWGIQGDLPLALGLDEASRVEPAMNIVANGDLNPHYLNHPSSTVIYPLAAIYHAWEVLFYQGDLFQANRAVNRRFTADFSEFYLLGRYLSVIFAVLNVPLVYLVGKMAFNSRVGLLGAWLAIFPVLAKTYAQLVRDDVTATFFTLLSLYFCLKLYITPTRSHHIKAGIVIGLALATRYLMAFLIPILVLVDGLLVWRNGLLPLKKSKPFLVNAALGGLFIGIAFVVTTPYFVISFSEAVDAITNEARTEHLGADGLSPPENFMWYLTEVIPGNDTLTWPVAILTLAGMLLLLLRPQPRSLILLAFAGIYIIGISMLALHRQRWLIPALPVLALFAAYAIDAIRLYLPRHQRWLRNGLPLLLLTVVSAWPTYQLMLDGFRLDGDNTRLLAGQWMANNLPAASKIAIEEYSIVLDDSDRFEILGDFSLARVDWSRDEAYRYGIRYLVVSSEVYNRFFNEADRYPVEVALYNALFSEEILLKEFSPAYTQRGPTIRIYQLNAR